MIITYLSDIQNIKILLKKYIMDNQAKDLKLEKDRMTLSQTRKGKSVKRKLENARKKK